MAETGAEPDYEPPPEASVAAIAQREGRAPLEVAYDLLMQLNGEAIIYFPSFNDAYGDLSQLYTQFQHPRTMMSPADGGVARTAATSATPACPSSCSRTGCAAARVGRA